MSFPVPKSNTEWIALGIIIYFAIALVVWVIYDIIVPRDREDYEEEDDNAG